MNRIEFVLVLLFTFFVIVVWITSDVILATPQTAEDPKIQKLPSMLEALSPNFDTKTIEQINNLKIAQPTTIQSPPPTSTPAPSPSPVNAARRSSPTPRPSPSPVASSASADLLFGSDVTTATTPVVPSPTP